MLDWVLFNMSSENFLLCISELWTHNKVFSNLTFIFSCYIVAFGKNVVTLQAESKWKMKSEKWKIQITLFNQRPRAEILTCIFHFSFFTFHLSKSASSPYQVRCKSHSGVGGWRAAMGGECESRWGLQAEKRVGWTDCFILK